MPIDPLELDSVDFGSDEDFQTMSTDFPLLPNQEMELVVHDINLEVNARKDGKNVVIEFQTTEEHLSPNTGKTLKPGYKLKKWCPLQAKPGSDWDWTSNFAELSDALLGTVQGARPNPREVIDQIQGRTCRARIGTRKLPDSERELNDIIGLTAS